MKAFFRWTLALALVLALSTAGRAATLVGVNFAGGQNAGGGGTGAASVTGTAGVVPQPNWNNALTNSGTIANAISSTGAATGATVSWTSPNTWASGGPSGGGTNASLMSGYLDTSNTGAGNPGQASFSVTNVPAVSGSLRKYDLYVYFSTDSAGTFGYRATDSNGYNVTEYGRQAGGAGTNYPLAGTDGFIVSSDTTNSGSTLASNVVKFSGLTGSTANLVGIVGAAGDPRPRINGFQIVTANLTDLPEPGTIAIWSVLGLVGAGVGYRRYRSAKA